MTDIPASQKIAYNKPPFTLVEQLQQLKTRGMNVSDDDRALLYLGQLNYYRLCAYWLPFEQNHETHRFTPGTDFEQVLDLYIFDRELRLLIIDAVERIEVAVRTRFAYQLSHKYGSHPHLKPELFHNASRYRQSLTKLENEVRRSSEDFINHLMSKYSERLPPIWATVELMTLGQLSSWYANLKHRKDRRAVADGYQLDEKILVSFLHHLSIVRNHCAHHARIWNREFTVTFKLPSKRPASLHNNFNFDGNSVRKLYNTLVMITYLLDLISPGSRWKERVKVLIDKHQIDTAAMGFPADWLERSVWAQCKVQ